MSEWGWDAVRMNEPLRVAPIRVMAAPTEGPQHHVNVGAVPCPNGSQRGRCRVDLVYQHVLERKLNTLGEELERKSYLRVCGYRMKHAQCEQVCLGVTALGGEGGIVLVHRAFDGLIGRAYDVGLNRLTSHVRERLRRESLLVQPFKAVVDKFENKW